MNKFAAAFLTIALLSLSSVPAEARGHHNKWNGWNGGGCNNNWNGGGCNNNWNGGGWNGWRNFRNDNGRHLGWYKHRKGSKNSWFAGRNRWW